MIIRNKFNGYINGNNRLYPGGGGGGQTTSTGTTYTTNIPEYARPYVDQMLGATQKQIFTGTGSGSNFQPTGFNNYMPFGATPLPDAQGNPLKDSKGNIVYTNNALQQAQAAVAPMSFGQQAAISGINQYVAPQQTDAASQIAGSVAGKSALGGVYSPLRAERFQLGAPQQVRSDSFTAPYVSQAYMSPYMQNVVNTQQREAMRQGEVQRNQLQAQAVGQGAYGGSRQAIMEAERRRNLSTQLGDIQAQGLQNAYGAGQQQFNAEQGAYLQAQQANQQANLNTGIQNQQAQLQAQNAQEASRQFGANLGLQGYGQTLQAAQLLGNMGQQQYSQDMGTMQAMSEMGAKEQAQQQAIINQQIQNYATQQQYPYMQLGIMSNMLRGLPMQAGNTSMYQAQPMGIQQLVGTAGALYNMGQVGKKEGGVIKMADGGAVPQITGGIESGVNPYQLPSMAKRLSDPQLQQKLANQQTDPATMGIMQAEAQRRANTRSGVVNAAGGGMIAFAEGSKKPVDEVDNPFKDNPIPIREDIGKEKSGTPTEKAKKKAADVAPKSKDMYSEYDEAVKAAGEGAFTKTKASMVEREKALPTLQAEADKSIATRVADMRQTNKDLGVEDKHTKVLRDSFVKQIEASAGESKDEARMRQAQAWAVFGSTPGPLLKVGLQALTGYIDDTIADDAKRKKMQNELKKSLYELDRSSYLESSGMVKEAREHHRQAFDSMMNIRNQIADDHNKLETTEYNRKIDAAKSKLAARKDIEEKRIARTNAGDSKEAQIYQRQADSVNRIRDQFEKRHQTELENLRQVANLPETSNGDYQKKAVERLKEIDKERDKLNERLAKEFPLVPNLVSTKPAAPSAAPTAADIAFTAKKNGVSEDEVRKRLGIK
jgi:hypothetical protein